MRFVKKIFLCLVAFLVFSTPSFGYFEDVTYHSDPYWDAINYLEEQGIISGYEEGYGTFYRSMNRINRAEFLKIVMGAANYKSSGGNCFKDVKEEWYAPYVCKGKELGIIDGYSDGTFKPANYINFAEASKIIINAFEIDLADVSGGEWFEKYVVSLENLNSIPQSIGSFSKELTREDMAEMIYRLMANVTDRWSGTYELIKAVEEYEALGSSVDLDYIGYRLQDRMNDPKHSDDILPDLAKKYDIKVSDSENPDSIDHQVAEEIKIIAAVFMDIDYQGDPGAIRDWVYHASYKDTYFFLYSFGANLFISGQIDTGTFEFLGLYDYCFDSHEITLEEYDMDAKKGWCDGFYDHIHIGAAPFGDTVLAKDKNHVYHIKEDSLVVLEGFDPEKFVKNTDGNVDIYLANEKDVYYSANNEMILLEGADAGTFKYLLGDFYIDDDGVYYFDGGNTAFGNVDDDSMYKIDNADPKTFKFLHLEGLYSFWGDNEDIFVAGRYETTVFPIEGVSSNDAKIYSFVENGFVSLLDEMVVNPHTEFPEGSLFNVITDSDKIYLFNNLKSEVIEGFDVDTFEFLYGGYLTLDKAFVKDKNGMYFLNSFEVTELKDADPETFDYYDYFEENFPGEL